MLGRFANRLSLTNVLGVAAFIAVAWLAYDAWLRPSPFREHFDVVIQNGTVVDGSGRKSFRADVGIRNGRIAAIGSLGETTAERIIEADGLVVAPGFIDVHTHVEKNLPGGAVPFRAPNFIRQGVTTIITGNCGNSMLSIRDLFARLEENGSQINVATLIGHNTIRRKIMNKDDRKPARAEMKAMRKLVAQAMSDGALGLSTGLAYVPGSFSKEGELVKLARTAARQGGLYVSHIRDEGRHGAEAIEEALDIGERAGIPVHISHFKASGRNQWGTAGQRLALVDEATERGVRVTIDQYPYAASSSGLDLLVPTWALAGDNAEVSRRLRDPVIRERVCSEMTQRLREDGWEDYDFARIAYCASNTHLNGFSIRRIALKDSPQPVSDDETGFDTRRLPLKTANDHQRSPVVHRLKAQQDVILDLVARGGAQMIYFDMNDEDVREILRHKDTMFGSDSAVRSETTEAMPHPRGCGTFPRVFSEFVRRQETLTLEEAIRRMTSLPARVFGLPDRGLLREDYWADIVVFDPRAISDTATYERPLKRPEGISCVVVNGNIVLRDNRLTTAAPGRMIRNQRLPRRVNIE